MKFDTLKSFFAKQPAPVASAPSGARPDQDLQIAACALLLEMAHADEAFTDDERASIEEALARHFSLGAEAAKELMAIAENERREAADLHQFTSVVNRHYDEGQRMVLAEVLWRIVYADGALSKHEDYLARKLANLLDLRPGYLSEARNRAQK